MWSKQDMLSKEKSLKAAVEQARAENKDTVALQKELNTAIDTKSEITLLYNQLK